MNLAMGKQEVGDLFIRELLSERKYCKSGHETDLQQHWNTELTSHQNAVSPSLDSVSLLTTVFLSNDFSMRR
jgi:hypothetical protein